MHHFISHHKMFFIREVCILAALPLFMIACQGQSIDCAPAVCNCPEKHEIPDKIQLSQLDNDSRERIKAEVLSEIKAELRAEWIKEFEAEKQAPIVPINDVEEETKSDTKPAIPESTFVPLPPTQKIERDSGRMKILRHLLTTQVVHRLPADERNAFSVSESSVYCFVEISAADAEDRTITIKFTHSTGLSQSYSLPVSQSPAWRTWSKLNLTKSMTGKWLCEVFNEDNTLLSSSSFIVVD